MRRIRIAAASAAAITFAVSACGASGPRVIVRNDTSQPQHVFYCSNDQCTRGLSGNDTVLKPGEEAPDYWNSADPTGPIGIASYPGERLIGCLRNPSDGQADPPTRTVLTSQATPCAAGPASNPQVQITNP